MGVDAVYVVKTNSEQTAASVRALFGKSEWGFQERDQAGGDDFVVIHSLSRYAYPDGGGVHPWRWERVREELHRIRSVVGEDEVLWYTNDLHDREQLTNITGLSACGIVVDDAFIRKMDAEYPECPDED